MQNLSVSTEAIWATFGADVPSSGEVWQSRGKMREIGTNSAMHLEILMEILMSQKVTLG